MIEQLRERCLRVLFCREASYWDVSKTDQAPILRDARVIAGLALGFSEGGVDWNAERADLLLRLDNQKATIQEYHRRQQAEKPVKKLEDSHWPFKAGDLVTPEWNNDSVKLKVKCCVLENNSWDHCLNWVVYTEDGKGAFEAKHLRKAK